MACILVLAHVIAKKSSFYNSLTSKKHDTFEPESVVNSKLKNRHEMLDGLRGFLALGVLFQHAVTNFAYFNTGIWKITDVRFYRHAGGEAVILFFMITSFLYWSKAITSKGFLDTKSLYKNRFKRLAPMYLFSATIVTLSVLVQNNFHIYSVITFIKDVASWLTLGLITTTSIDGISVIPINAGIHWTLHYEWIFYLLLPFTAMVLRGGYYRLFAIPLVSLVFMLNDRGYWVIFLFGIVAASIVHKWPKIDWIYGSGTSKNWWVSLIPIIGLLMIYEIQYKPYSMLQYVISLCVLLLFIYGNSFFGLLKTRAALFLGTISYSVYLMHGIILFVVLHLANTIIPIKDLAAIHFWALILITALVTVLSSTITYKYVEHPFLKKK
ncbi:MAG: acyltransferase [Candidatus Pacebacteria bacterium]|nr:acyltransferase [Candidatus Paceibacterota bacterium]